jgi:glycosyltransferase involved in cell wall biosynthesis
MRILILMRNSVSTSRGGAEVQADFLREACIKAGHEVHFAFDSKSTIEHPDDSTTYHTLPDNGRIKSWKNYSAIKGLVKEINPDLVYQRVRFSYTGLAAIASRCFGAKFVHNISADYACKKNPVPFGVHFIANFITEHLGRYGLRHADLLISQTASQAGLLKSNFGLDSIVIPNAHPVPDHLFTKSTPPIVAWVANIKSWKQPEIFVDLAKRFSNTNARFIMAGKPGGAKYQERILRLIEDAPNIEYVGQLTIEEVNTLLSEAAIFINTSEPREGFPNTYIQAWMRKTPVISLNFDPDDINTRNDIGYLSGNFEQLVKDVEHLLSSPTMLSDMGIRARQYSIKKHDTDVTGALYLKEFEKLLN